MITSKKGGASAASDMLLPGKAGGTVAVRRTLASTICRIADPTQVPRPRQLRDASTVMRFQPAHQSMINRRFDDRAPCLAWMSPKQALAGKPRIHSPASGIGGHESGRRRVDGSASWRRSQIHPCETIGLPSENARSAPTADIRHSTTFALNREVTRSIRKAGPCGRAATLPACRRGAAHRGSGRAGADKLGLWPQAAQTNRQRTV